MLKFRKRRAKAGQIKFQKEHKVSLRGAKRRSNLDHSQLRDAKRTASAKADCRALTLFGLAMIFTFILHLDI